MMIDELIKRCTAMERDGINQKGRPKKICWNGVNFRFQKIEAQRGLSACQGMGH